ncbi:MAG TPA: hypothetical protein VMM13_00935 [Euzebya sp.]|nr:hypothetical protein [Euzebya sp.]
MPNHPPATGRAAHDMSYLDRTEARLWDRFVRDGGPSKLDRLTLTRPLLVGAGMVVGLAAIYVLIGRVMLASDADATSIAEAGLYATMFSATWMVIWRRSLREVVQRWDDQSASDEG